MMSGSRRCLVVDSLSFCNKSRKLPAKTAWEFCLWFQRLRAFDAKKVLTTFEVHRISTIRGFGPVVAIDLLHDGVIAVVQQFLTHRVCIVAIYKGTGLHVDEIIADLAAGGHRVSPLAECTHEDFRVFRT